MCCCEQILVFAPSKMVEATDVWSESQIREQMRNLSLFGYGANNLGPSYKEWIEVDPGRQCRKLSSLVCISVSTMWGSNRHTLSQRLR